ncbi:MAG TPA: N-acetylmuramoyl-L-alanine amidase [Acidimicrobiia bacterium]|nr:N-acetylmuramoyl-L-alanine amidase [Acidimicrobiia bacterium]
MSPLTRRQFIGAATGLVVACNGLATPSRALTINPRSAWGADLPPKGELSAEDVRFLIVHHSASHNGHNAADVPDILRGWYHFHTGPDKGWPDIAYNFIIDSEGGVWEGRQGSLDGPVAGSATGGNQGFTQLVCVIGDTGQAPATPAASATLVSVLGWLADRYQVATTAGAEVTFTSRGSNRWPSGASVTTPTIAGHRDMSQTSCPGANLYTYVTGGLMADVESARGGSAPSASPSTTPTTLPPTTTTTSFPTTTITVPDTTTTGAPPSTSTTTIETSTSTVPGSSFTVPTTQTTIPLASGATGSGPGAPAALIVTGASLLVAAAGVLAWRSRRMGG